MENLNIDYILYAPPLKHEESMTRQSQQQQQLNDLMAIRLSNSMMINNRNTISQQKPQSQNTIPLQPLNQFNQLNHFSSTPIKISKMKKFKRYEQIRCVVCGDVSSGFHYGAYTCEACKLFFIRSEKHSREFNQCIHGNCYVNIEKRKTCGSCRYKACIANGMNLNRRRFGRHTAETLTYINEREHEPNIQLRLIQLYNEFDSEMNKYFTTKAISQAIQQVDRTQEDLALNRILNNFYLKSMDILNVSDIGQIFGSGSSYPIDNGLKITNTILSNVYLALLRNNASHGSQALQFCQYDNNIDILLHKMNVDLRRLMQYTLDQLNGNELTVKMRTIIFILLVNSLYTVQFELEFDLASMQRRNRIIDFIKSEFMLFKSSSSPSSTNEQRQADSIDLLFNIFLLQLSEMEILQNSYFNLIKLNSGIGF